MLEWTAGHKKKMNGPDPPECENSKEENYTLRPSWHMASPMKTDNIAALGAFINNMDYR